MSKQQTLDSKFIETKVRCEVCRREFKQITNTHLNTHKLTINKYHEKYPDAVLTSEGTRQKISEVTSGENSGSYGKEAWSKGLTKETNDSLKKMSEALLGEKNGNYGKGYLMAGENHPNWQGGISNLPYCEKFDDDLKERVREFFNGCCYVCGVGQSELGYKLDVHHVNYNKMVCCNDVKPLFVPLCRSCHMKTNFDREYWEEFFTVSLEYLTDGECFIKKEVKK